MVLSHIDNMQANARALMEGEEELTYFDTIEAISEGRYPSINAIERAVKLQDLSVGQFLVKPGEDASRWRDSDSRFVPQAINAYLDAFGETVDETARLAQMSNTMLYAYRNATVFPSIEAVQVIADVFGIEIADLFIKPNSATYTLVESHAPEQVQYKRNKAIPKVPKKLISHWAYLGENMKRLMLFNGVDKPPKSVQNIMSGAGGWLTVEKNANRYGASVGDMLVRPGFESEWYHECALRYFAPNVREAMEAVKISEGLLAQMTKVNPSKIRDLMADGTMPNFREAQKIADVLEMEIADLFLPI